MAKGYHPKTEFKKGNIGKFAPHWRGGNERFKCIDCGKILKNRYAKRCRKCNDHIKIMSEEHKRKLNNAWRGRHHTEESKRKMRGENCPLWKGGISPAHMAIRASEKYKQWRQSIFFRDNFTCQDCGQHGGYLEVHHIKTFSRLLDEARINLPLLNLFEAAMLYTPLWDLNNGKTLCDKCHNKTRGGNKKCSRKFLR